MWIGVLGPLEVVAADGAPVTVGGPRPRALLALLAFVSELAAAVEGLASTAPARQAAFLLPWHCGARRSPAIRPWRPPRPVRRPRWVRTRSRRHSNVRRLAFGPEHDYVHHLGHYYALANLDIAGEALMYNEPGRMVALGGPKAPSFFVFAADELSYDRYDAEQQKKLVLDAYRGGSWRVPEILAKIPASADFFLDSISRVDMNDYAKGRVALLGDAA